MAYPPIIEDWLMLNVSHIPVIPHEFVMAHPPSSITIYSRATFFTIITLLVLGWISVLLRMWVRIRITKSAGWDDVIMVLTLVRK